MSTNNNSTDGYNVLRENPNTKQSPVKNKVIAIAMGTALVGTMFTGVADNKVEAADLDGVDINVDWFGDYEKDDIKELDISLQKNGEVVEGSNITIAPDDDGNWVGKTGSFTIDDDDYAEGAYKLVIDHAKIKSDYEVFISGDAQDGYTVNLIKLVSPNEGYIIERHVDATTGQDILNPRGSGTELGQYYGSSAHEITGYKEGSIVKGSSSFVVETGVHEVIYEYERESDVDIENAEIEGSILVRYVDEKGDVIRTTSTQSGVVDSDFEIEQREIAGYTFDEEATDMEALSGQYKNGIHEVTLHYVKDDLVDNSDIRGGVVVKYVDEHGIEIHERSYDSGLIAVEESDYNKGQDADTYRVEPKDIEGYGLLSNKTVVQKPGSDAENIGGVSITGDFVEGFTTVTFVYDEVKETPGYENFSNVLVKYVDESGNEIGVRDRIFNEIGEAYTTNPKKIDGYTLVKEPSNAEGKITDKTTEVRYVYKKDNEDDVAVVGEVVAKYINKDGEEISERTSVKGDIGTSYETEKKDIKGYEFTGIKGEADAKGKFAEGVTTIEYVYDKIDKEEKPEEKPEIIETNVVTKYFDTDGNELVKPVTQKGEVGEDYTTEQKEIDGYTFKEVKGDAKGTFGEKDILIEYIYVKDEVKDEDDKDENDKDDGDKDKDDGDKDNDKDDNSFVITHDFAVDLANGNATLDDVYDKYGEPKLKSGDKAATVLPIYVWEDSEGNLLFGAGFKTDGLLNDGSGSHGYVYYFDANAHEFTEGPLHDKYDTIKDGDTLDDLNKRFGTDGSTDIFILPDDAITMDGLSYYVWGSEDLAETFMVSIDEDGNAVAKVYLAQDGFALETSLVNDEDDANNDDNNNNDGNDNAGNNNDDNTGNDGNNDSNNDGNTNNGSNNTGDNNSVDDGTNSDNVNNNGAGGNGSDNNDSDGTNNNNDNKDDGQGSTNDKNDDKKPKATTMENNPKTNGEVGDPHGVELDENGKPLADTATNTFNILAIGASVLAFATGGLFFANRRREDTAEDAE